MPPKPSRALRRQLVNSPEVGARRDETRSRDIPAPQLARTITVFALSWYAAVSVINVMYTDPGLKMILVCASLVVVLFAVQFSLTLPRVRRWPLWLRCAALGLLAVLTYLPFLMYGLDWGAMAGPLAGSVLLQLTGRTSWAVFALVIGSALGIALLTGSNAYFTVYLTMSTVLAGLVVWGFTRLSDLVAEVHAARADLARMAVTQERMRFSRDLHDLLGYSLSAITLKSELLYRLIGDRSDQAREEVASILDVSRQALSDVRLVASGYRDMSLASEADSAASILAAAGVQAEVDVECGRLHPLVDTVLATALREGITNILRHSKVQHCSITAAAEGETVRLTLVNDGVGEGIAILSPHSGSGIGNLQLRLTAVGGRVDAGVRDDGRFHLVAEAPLRPEPQTAEPSSEDTAARPAA
jgi:two-component system sensor histidine kinase DesK